LNLDLGKDFENTYARLSSEGIFSILISPNSTIKTYSKRDFLVSTFPIDDTNCWVP